ncbi:helix-turn-helix transcriptional regulator [Rhodococcus opacus]|nr:helix-turn-helix transcriptional regulator [Rhodococcus opacus]
MPGTRERNTPRQDARSQIRDFLITRRARLTPAQAGLSACNTDRRRVKGLRREEVAILAGISSEYYVRLERGNATGISESIIDSIATALQLDEAERMHLLDLLRAAATTRPPRRRAVRQVVRPTIQRVLDSLHGTPAFVLNGRLDVVAANQLGYALYAPLYANAATPNVARFTFLDPAARQFFREPDRVADDLVALLRAEAGRDPHDRELSHLIGELSTRSDDFRVRWGAHNVRIHSTDIKLIRHPVVGNLDLPYESLAVDRGANQSLLTFVPEAGSPTQDALDLLASWAATGQGQTERMFTETEVRESNTHRSDS